MVSFHQPDVESRAVRIGGMADQIPFAISRALNDVVSATETRLAGGPWARHTTNRDMSVLKTSLNVENASKGGLHVFSKTSWSGAIFG